MLVYFGIAEEVDEHEAPRRSKSVDSDPWDEPAPRRRSNGARRPSSAPASRFAEHAAGVGVVPPRTFNDAQQIADHFKRGVPVIVNMQATDSELAKRLIDFASGLTYGLDGGMQRIADRVFLLTPVNVDVTAEDRAAIVESGAFFNQS
jgi:cell division inhibitor SepF